MAGVCVALRHSCQHQRRVGVVELPNPCSPTGQHRAPFSWLRMCSKSGCPSQSFNQSAGPAELLARACMPQHGYDWMLSLTIPQQLKCTALQSHQLQRVTTAALLRRYHELLQWTQKKHLVVIPTFEAQDMQLAYQTATGRANRAVREPSFVSADQCKKCNEVGRGGHPARGLLVAWGCALLAGS